MGVGRLCFLLFILRLFFLCSLFRASFCYLSVFGIYSSQARVGWSSDRSSPGGDFIFSCLCFVFCVSILLDLRHTPIELTHSSSGLRTASAIFHDRSFQQ